MGAGSSIDKALGHSIDDVRQGGKTVLSDQVQAATDFYTQPLTTILPIGVGVLTIIISVIFLAVYGRHSGSQGITSGKLIPLIGIGLGFLLIAATLVVFSIRHPRASAEMFVAQSISNLF